MNSRLLRVIDADTVELAIGLCKTEEPNKTLGFGLSILDGVVELKAPIRVAGCNAWERGTVPGREATRFLRSLLPVGSDLYVFGIHRDKFGRFVASLNTADGRDVASTLVNAQWAVNWNGRGLRPVPPWPRTITP